MSRHNKSARLENAFSNPTHIICSLYALFYRLIPSSVALSSVCKILLPARQMLCLVAQMCVWLHQQQQTGQFESVVYSVQSVRTGSKQASTCGGRETAAVNTLFSGNSVQLKAPRHQLPLQPQQLLLSESSALLSSSTSKLFNRPNFGLTSDDNWSNLLRLIESLSLYFKVKPPFYNTPNKDKTKRL